MEIHNIPAKEGRKRILEGAHLMGISSNIKWFEKILNLGWYNRPSNVRDSEELYYKQSMLKMFTIYKEHYKENFDVQIRDGKILFKVLYPEFWITNSQGKQSLIRDLMVIHTFSYSEVGKHVYPERIQGMRLTRTSEEIFSGYIHSHLFSSSYDKYRDNPFYISSFCVGNETDIARMEAEFEVMMDYNRMELYLFVVDSMVQWESIEGTPYIRIEKIQNSNYTIISDSISGYEQIARRIIRDKMVVDVDFYFDGKNYKIKNNKRASDFVKQIVLQEFSARDQRRVLCTYNYFIKAYVGMDPKDTVIGRPLVNDKYYGTPYNIFNGVKRYCKAIQSSNKANTKVLTTEDYIIYPKFLDYVLRELESKLSKKTSTRSAIAYLNSLNNSKQCITSDKISL